jgi:microcystin-dependent protein
MSDPYLGEIRMVGFNYAPVGWALCNGQTMSISQYSALFALLGTTYGGNGQTTFNLPDLQGRVAIHAGSGAGLPIYVQGQKGGATSVTLQTSNLPAHTHPVTPPVSNVAGTSNSPVNAYPAVDATTVTVSTPPNGHATAVTNSYSASAVAGQSAAAYQSGAAGGNTPVSIEPPYLAVYFIIAMSGIFPPRS